MKKPTESDYFLFVKRERKLLHRLHKRHGKHRGGKTGARQGRLGAYNSGVLQLLDTHSRLKPLKDNQNRITVYIPSEFSIIASPEDALTTSLRLVKSLRRHRTKEVSFDHSQMTKVDLAAESILDLVAIEARRERKSRADTLRVGGFYPNDQDLKRYIRAIGIIKNLDIRHELLSEKEESTLSRVLKKS